MKSGSQDAPAPLTLFYDGSCPLCATEVGYYKRSDTCQALILVDVSSEQFSGDERINRREAMARFHIRLAEGQQLSGAPAFVEVWRVVPGWRWLARLADLPGALPVLEACYRIFLNLRPLIVRGFAGYQRLSGKSSARCP